MGDGRQGVLPGADHVCDGIRNGTNVHGQVQVVRHDRDVAGAGHSAGPACRGCVVLDKAQGRRQHCRSGTQASNASSIDININTNTASSTLFSFSFSSCTPSTATAFTLLRPASAATAAVGSSSSVTIRTGAAGVDSHSSAPSFSIPHNRPLQPGRRLVCISPDLRPAAAAVPKLTTTVLGRCRQEQQCSFLKRARHTPRRRTARQEIQKDQGHQAARGRQEQVARV